MSEVILNDLERVWVANRALETIEKSRALGNEPTPEDLSAFNENIDAFSNLQPTIIERLRAGLVSDIYSDEELLAAAYDGLAESEAGDNEETICIRALSKITQQSNEQAPTSQEGTVINQTQIKQFELIKNGNADALAWLIDKYGGYVKHMANRYALKLPRHASAIDFDDLVQEGMVGLLRAAQTYQGDQGANFITYSTYHIRSSIIRHIRNMSSTVRIPTHIREKIEKIDHTNQQRIGQRRPLLSVEEVADLVDVYPDDRFRSNRVGDRIAVADLNHARLIGNNMGSIDTGYSPHNDISPGNDYILDRRVALQDIVSESAVSVDEEAINSLNRQQMLELIDAAFNDLSETERFIVASRFGLDGSGETKTLEEVAELCGVTREKVRQIEAHSLAKLRRPNTSSMLIRLLIHS